MPKNRNPEGKPALLEIRHGEYSDFFIPAKWITDRKFRRRHRAVARHFAAKLQKEITLQK